MYVQSLLQLGENFSIPIHNNDMLTMEFIKSFENNIRKLPAVNQLAIRNRSLNIINNLPFYSVDRDEFDETLNRLTLATKKFLNDNKNLILIRAEYKGNVTVALDKDKYVREIENLLMDTDTYTVIGRSPVKKLTNSVFFSFILF